MYDQQEVDAYFYAMGDQPDTYVPTTSLDSISKLAAHIQRGLEEVLEQMQHDTGYVSNFDFQEIIQALEHPNALTTRLSLLGKPKDDAIIDRNDDPNSFELRDTICLQLMVQIEGVRKFLVEVPIDCVAQICAREQTTHASNDVIPEHFRRQSLNDLPAQKEMSPDYLSLLVLKIEQYFHIWIQGVSERIKQAKNFLLYGLHRL